MAWSWLRLVCVATTQLWRRFFTMTQRASIRLRHTCCCYGMVVALQMLACPRSGCGRLAGSDLKARNVLTESHVVRLHPVQFETHIPSRAGSARPTALMSSRRLRSGRVRCHQELPPPALPP